MLNRETLVCSRNILISAMFAILAGSLSQVYAQEPSALQDKSTCLVKYSTLSAIMCDKKDDTLVKDVKGMMSPSPSPSPATAKDTIKEDPIREMKGIKKTYIYTDRINKDKAGIYTRLREKADVKSEKGEIVRPGDKVRVLKSEVVTDKKDKSKTEWYFVQIFKSYKPELEGKEGWIESWIVDDTNVPAEPTPTPSPTKTPANKNSATSSSSGGTVPVSGDGDTMFNMINEYRTGNGLPAFEKSDRLCSIAQERAPEIAGEVASGTVHSGFARRGLGYPVAVENEVGYGNLQANFNWWINSSLHRASILGPNLKYSCVQCAAGNCVQEFSPNP